MVHNNTSKLRDISACAHTKTHTTCRRYLKFSCVRLHVNKVWSRNRKKQSVELQSVCHYLWQVTTNKHYKHRTTVSAIQLQFSPSIKRPSVTLGFCFSPRKRNLHVSRLLTAWKHCTSALFAFHRKLPKTMQNKFFWYWALHRQTGAC